MTWRLEDFSCFGGIGAVDLDVSVVVTGLFGCKIEGTTVVVVALILVCFSSDTNLLGTAVYSGGFGRFTGSPKVEVEAVERLGESTQKTIDLR